MAKRNHNAPVAPTTPNISRRNFLGLALLTFTAACAPGSESGEYSDGLKKDLERTVKPLATEIGQYIIDRRGAPRRATGATVLTVDVPDSAGPKGSRNVAMLTLKDQMVDGVPRPAVDPSNPNRPSTEQMTEVQLIHLIPKTDDQGREELVADTIITFVSPEAGKAPQGIWTATITQDAHTSHSARWGTTETHHDAGQANAGPSISPEQTLVNTEAVATIARSGIYATMLGTRTMEE